MAPSCRLAREAVIVSNMASFGRLDRFLRKARFMPEHRHPEYWDTWWALPPIVVQEYLAILGKPRWLYTVVAHRDSSVADRQP